MHGYTENYMHVRTKCGHNFNCRQCYCNYMVDTTKMSKRLYVYVKRKI